MSPKSVLLLAWRDRLSFMKRWLLLAALFVGASGCGDEQSATFEVRESPADRVLFGEGRVRVSAQRAEGAVLLTLSRVDSGDPDVADSDGSVTLVLELEESALVEGSVLPVDGVTTFENGSFWLVGPPIADVWDGNAVVRRALLYAECFCEVSRGEASQRFDLQLHVEEVGDRLVGRIEGTVEGRVAYAGPVLQIVADFDVRID
ncbi:MAG: hypothetical protein R3B99_34685 [Polyangiales bacterium]